MGLGYGMMMGLDPTYILVIIALVFTLIVQGRMKSTFNKYSRIASACGLTGAMAAQRILESEGLYNVRVEHISGSLTDHYDPRTKSAHWSELRHGCRPVPGDWSRP